MLTLFVFTAALLVEPPAVTGAAPAAQWCGGRRGLIVRAAALCGGSAAAVLSTTAAQADVASMVLKYDSEGRMIDDYIAETQFRTLRQGDASMVILAAWALKEDGSYEDPTLGSAASSVEMRSSATESADTAALGRPERIDLVKTLDLESDLERADLVAAAVRKSDGITFYDFDLALSPKKCNTEMATACLPVKVILLSCAVRAGKLHVARVDANADQWKRTGTALRLLRSSFSVAAGRE